MSEELENEVKTPEEILLEMKKTMVPKTELESAQAKYNSLFQSVANGLYEEKEPVKELSDEEEWAKISASCKAIHDKKLTNPIEHAKTLLALDDYRQKQGERSAFVPDVGEITPEIEKTAQKTRQLLQDALDRCDGKVELYNALIANGIVDIV